MGVVCPKCGSKNVLFMEKYNRWHCREKHSAEGGKGAKNEVGI